MTAPTPGIGAPSTLDAVFGDPVVVTAILDRLLHQAHVLTIHGDSCRFRSKCRSGLLQKTAAAPKTQKD